jgi:phosphoribosylanthranilate isomerase
VVACKICDIRDLETAYLAAKMGADYLGLHAIWGLRAERISDYKRIARELPLRYPNLGLVLVTRSQDVSAIISMEKIVGFTHIQLHAPWSSDDISNLSEQLSSEGYNHVQIIGVVAPENVASVARVKEIRDRVNLLLLDSSFHGGTGQQIQNDLLDQAIQLAEQIPVFIGGGLTPENVGDVIETWRPYGVDVQSGVEEPNVRGVKSPKKLAAFLRVVKGRDGVDLGAMNL